jgi:hypothetical protein
LVVASVGRLVPVDDEYEPFRLLDGDGAIVVPVAVFFRELVTVHDTNNLVTLQIDQNSSFNVDGLAS